MLKPLRVREFPVEKYEDRLPVDISEHVGDFLEEQLILHFSWVYSAQKRATQSDCSDDAVLFRLVLHCLLFACNVIEVGEYDLCPLAFSQLNAFYHSVEVDELVILVFPLQNINNVLLIKSSIYEHKPLLECLQLDLIVGLHFIFAKIVGY